MAQYEKYCLLFIEGFLNLELFFEIENQYIKRKELFEICLN